jgi:hypothetical protein
MRAKHAKMTTSSSAYNSNIGRNPIKLQVHSVNAPDVPVSLQILPVIGDELMCPQDKSMPFVTKSVMVADF